MQQSETGCTLGSNVDADSAAEGSTEDDDALGVNILARGEVGDHRVGVHLYSLFIGLALASAIASVRNHEHVHLQPGPKHIHARKPHSHITSVLLFVGESAVVSDEIGHKTEQL